MVSQKLGINREEITE